MVAGATRGQATVEAALGILAFVTILVFGIHFAEVSYLSLKVAEAGNFAIWDATGRKHQNYTGTGKLSTGPRGTAISAAKAEAQDRYRDYDGRSSANGASPRQVFTVAEDIRVRCNEINGTAQMGDLSMPAALAGIYQNADEGGASCRAQGRLNILGIGSFHEGSEGFFRVDHVSRTTYPICSFGRANGGNCPGDIMFALADWGLADVAGQENAQCDLYACTNTRYKAAVRQAFDATTGVTGAAVNLASQVVNASPADNGEFWFTFKGEEAGFRQRLNGVHSGDDEWTVTPGGPYEAVPEYASAYGRRQDCWLGLPCNMSPR